MDIIKSHLKFTLVLFSLVFLSSCLNDDSSQPYIKVFKYDGSLQCQSQGIELDTMAFELINAGIDIVCSQKGHDGMVYTTVCGADTGNINIYSINTSNLPDAENLGFNPVSSLSEYQDAICE